MAQVHSAQGGGAKRAEPWPPAVLSTGPAGPEGAQASAAGPSTLETSAINPIGDHYRRGWAKDMFLSVLLNWVPFVMGVQDVP